MKVNGGFLKIESGKISYCLKPGKNHEHISLFKNHSLEPETLIKSWSIGEMDGLVMRRFLLKQNSVEIYFKTRKSVFFCFYGSSPEEYATIINELTLLCSLSNIGPDNILSYNMWYEYIRTVLVQRLYRVINLISLIDCFTPFLRVSNVQLVRCRTWDNLYHSFFTSLSF